ncbi:MAG: cytochrome c3 family protein [Thermodesulfobacteriota bacterium]
MVGATENSDCLECHSDAGLSRAASEGIKHELFVDSNRFKHSVHNINGIGCVDCHSDLATLNFDNEVPHSTSAEPVSCDNCHDAEARAYTNSVHRKASGKGINIPCYACHEYHYTSHLDANSVLERENAFCLKCHNPGKFHDWLPQKETHFAFVECTVCHAPDAPRHINLRFFDLVNNRFLTTPELMTAMGTTPADFLPLVDRNKDQVINAGEFDDMVFLLRQKDVRVTVHGELVIELQPSVHHVNRGVANRECEQCHVPTSPFFEEVRLTLAEPDRTTTHSNVERAVLESYHVSHFYALGGTRIRLLDKIGVGMIAAAAAVVTIHLLARIATIPNRRREHDEL